DLVGQAPPFFGGEHLNAIDAVRSLALVVLRYPPYADERVGVAPQHELLQGLDFLPVLGLRSLEDPLPQIADLPIGFAPVDALPVGRSVGSVYRLGLHLTYASICNHCLVLQGTHHVHVSGLSAWVSPVFRPYPPG